MRTALFVLLLAHGLIHFLGLARGLGLAELPELTQDISPRAGILWGIAGTALIVTAVLAVAAPRWWWALALPALLLSQAMVVSTWADSRFGTVPNVLILVLAVHAFAAHGPWSLRAAWERSVRETAGPVVPSGVVTEAELEPLPAPVRRFLRRAGAVGAPRVGSFRATWRGRIRGGPEEPWMTFTAEQVNVVDPPARSFFMDARRGGLPVDVFHAYRDGAATMTVRLVSLVPMVRASGPELTRAETVTLLNDLALLAPGALLDAGARWEHVDDRTARVALTVGAHTVSADLFFDEAGDLVDFVSDDRLMASADGATLTPVRWSTPISTHRDFGGRRAPTVGTGVWHPGGGAPWGYIELELTGLEMNPPPQ